MEYCDAGDLGDRVNEAKVCARDRQTDAGYICAVLVFVVVLSFRPYALWLIFGKGCASGATFLCGFRGNQQEVYLGSLMAFAACFAAGDLESNVIFVFVLRFFPSLVDESGRACHSQHRLKQ